VASASKAPMFSGKVREVSAFSAWTSECFIANECD
jgi:hypothetical protein